MLSTKTRRLHFWITAAGDGLAILAGFFLAYWVRFSEVVVPAHRGIPPFEAYFKSLVIVIPVYVWVLRSYGLYRSEKHIRRVEEIFRVLKGVAFGSLILMALTFFYREFTYSRVFLIFLWVSVSLSIGLVRYLLIQWRYSRRRRDQEVQRILIVGANRHTRQLIEWAEQNPHFGHRIEGILTQGKDLIGKHFEGVPVLGDLGQYDSLIEKHRPDEVIIVDPSLPREQATRMLLDCEDRMISFRVAADLYGLVTSNLDVEYVASVPLLGLRNLPLDDFWNRASKRIFDFAVSGALLGVLLPVMGLIALLIKLGGPGPLFYVQERVGQDGQSFRLYKFRTMRPHAEAETGPVWAKKEDERVTGTGKFLRRFNLDELPQIWNVLKGEMSLVGPRPERPHFVDQFRGEIPRYMARHKIKSGITGWAQVNGLRGNTSLQERIKYDLYYAENWSLLFDIEILFMTLFAFKNAY